MMTLGQIYERLLKRQLVLTSLRKGVQPTAGSIEKQYLELVANNPYLSSPITDPEQYTILQKEEGSADKFNTTFKNLYVDLQILYDSSQEVATEASSFAEKTTVEFKRLEKEVEDLDESVNSLLLMAEDVEGYLDFVFDNFTNNSKINLLNSSVIINNQAQAITLPVNKQQRIKLNLISDDIQVNILTRDYFSTENSVVELPPINAFLNQDKYWLQRATYSKVPSEAMVELIVRMPSTVEFSKMIIRPLSVDRGKIVTIAIFYSEDSLNWYTMEGENTKRIVGETVYYFTPIQPKYVRLLISKTGYDAFLENLYQYDFGLKEVEFYGVDFTEQGRIKEANLYSNPLTLTEIEGFNKVSLKACEYTPKDTSIDYRVALMTAADYTDYINGTLDLVDLPYSDIDPINRDFKIHPTVVDGAKIDRLMNYASSYGLDSTSTFKYEENLNNVLVDTYTIPTTVKQESLEVWRNTGNNSLDGGSNQPVKVNGVDHGWLLEGDYYSCEFYVIETTGKTIDFGQKEFELDGQRQIGRLKLEYGKHKFKTHRNNWYPILPATITLPTDSNPDILYPFNHKYLVEGIGDTLYGVDLTLDLGGKTAKEIIDPNLIYGGVDKFWGKTLKYVTLFEFAYKVAKDDYTVFSIVEDSNLYNRIIVKYNYENSLFAQEKFAIIENREKSELYKYIVLHAKLRTIDKYKTPILSSYYIRLGY